MNTSVERVGRAEFNGVNGGHGENGRIIQRAQGAGQGSGRLRAENEVVF